MATRTNTQNVSLTSVPYLNIVTFQELQEFLQEIQPGFLDVVDPWESGLLDHMNSEGLVTDLDRESLCGKYVHTDRDERRKVWFLLTNLSIADMKTKVFPKLYAKFPHIIPPKFVTHNGGDSGMINELDHNKCLRHQIMGIVRPQIAIDKMYQYNCLDLEGYKRFNQDGCEADLVWNTLFNKCRLKGASLSPMIADLMKMHRIPVPASLEEPMSHGIPCTCNDATADLPAALLSLSGNKVNAWLGGSQFQRSPRSSSHSWDIERGSLWSISADRSEREESQSLINTDNTSLAYSAATPHPPPADHFGATGGLGLSRDWGHRIEGLSFVHETTLQVGVTCSNPLVETKIGKFQPPSLPSAPVPAVEAMESQHDLSLSGGQSRTYCTNLTPTPARRGAPANMPMSGLSEKQKFISRHHMSIIAFLVITLLFVLAMNGLNIFQLTKRLCDLSQQPLDHKEAPLMKNLTRALEMQAKQNSSKT